jgi:uncharacterized ferritin-like protein (DUF455 family)
MELRDWAMRVFSADCLEEKLVLPPDGLKALTDHKPGPAVAWSKPPRPSHLQVAHKRDRKRIPHPSSLNREDMRIRCLHAFANHELMALELMAWALLAFPDADKSFRKGLANVLIDEQRHFQLYVDRLQEMGTQFGDLPLNDHFWRAAKDINDPLDWVCTMHLTFEQANLDHAPYFSRLFREVEDQASADLMQVIFQDEIRHVRFGSRWLQNLLPAGSTMFETYAAHCSQTNSPFRAKGPEFQHQARLQAGLDVSFINSLRAWEADE